MVETKLCLRSSLSGCEKRMAEWQPTRTPMLQSFHAPLGVVAVVLLYWQQAVFLSGGVHHFLPLALPVAPLIILIMMWAVFPHPPALDETSYEAGIKVQLHTQSEPPFLHELGFGVAPGFQTFVSTQEQRVAYDCLGLLHATNAVLLNSYTPIIKFHNFIRWLPLPVWGMDLCVPLCVAEATTCNNICSPSLSSLSSLFNRYQ